MLVSYNAFQFGGARLAMSVALAGRYRLHASVRDRLAVDSRYYVPSTVDERQVTVWLLLGGRARINGGAALGAPAAWLLSDHEFEHRADGADWFAAAGAPLVTLEVRVAAGDVRAPTGLARGPQPLAPATWEAAHRAVASLRERAPDRAASVRALMRGLADDGVLDPALASHEAGPDVAAQGLADAVSALYTRAELLPQMKQLASVVGRSLRQLGRDLDNFCVTFGMPGRSFREATRVLRLRMAVVLLSAPEGTPVDVARRVGYGSVSAMGRAFRDAGLPPPGRVREAVLAAAAL